MPLNADNTSSAFGGAGWSSCGVTDTGLHRSHNEDALLDRSDLCLWAVADGMGGHERGEVASAMLCQGLAAVSPDASLASLVDSIDDVVDSVNGQLVAMGAGLPGGGIVGSTLVVMVACGDFAVCLWAGDSRLYRLRQGTLSLLSEDHSLYSQLRMEGMADESSASNVITRAVGASDMLCLDMDIFVLQPHDRYMLCSDGLYNELDDNTLYRLLNDGSAYEAAHRLVSAARDNGGHDNITAVVADYGFAG